MMKYWLDTVTPTKAAMPARRRTKPTPAKM
jgi:hypothetical protein